MAIKCIHCGEPDDRDSGPMISVCTKCLNKPRPPEPYIEKNGLLVPNPERKG